MVLPARLKECAVPDVVEFRREGTIAVITVNHPPVNALNSAMREGLVAALEHATAQLGLTWS